MTSGKHRRVAIATAIVAALAIVAAIAGVWIDRQHEAKQAAARELARLKAARAAELEQLANPETPAAVPSTAPPEMTNFPDTAPATPTSARGAAPARPAAPSTAMPPPSGGGIQDPLARVALSFVGVDRDAEWYWLEAINDPRLSADERRNLIEDLNEDGFVDPQRPSPAELPLIVNRLQLLEQIAPSAMDQVNWEAFMEAYKDLANMYVRLARQ